ncbi:pyridoxamine 5'-phosphate oxidase family protein [Coraliomargarita akajimensis]|uniref:Pyridoxamine 5'-phosphate oxidase-related FMN-binding protein n=1 Tax=Coraliomargarita akajimensis (strain DSM 45221 / IAM 15411 / JCM 23193 / KCTC 12865 / 04OKA010-24) TaxID=583355 RepID=D5EQM7_CORAD|nr:pyridoxamine 5'-phosphate oxidase family protein [Coraliomargarita akajimensis]ADE55841.1 pyridoxamine 5'-phosphate oxidase-related FMN- binding protein [Coraliomargarita akajimensis DSM 45221]
MISIPDSFWEAFSQLKGPCILSTTDADGTPNSIYVGVLKRVGDQIVIVDSAFSKTRENLLRGSTCSFLFITEQFAAYQAKCTADYVEDDASIAAVQEWTPVTYSPKAVLKLNIQCIYTGATKIA